MTAKNDITGDSIRTKNTTQSYLDNYDKIFGVKGRKKTPKHGATQIHKDKSKTIPRKQKYKQESPNYEGPWGKDLGFS